MYHVLQNLVAAPAKYEPIQPWKCFPKGTNISTKKHVRSKFKKHVTQHFAANFCSKFSQDIAEYEQLLKLGLNNFVKTIKWMTGTRSKNKRTFNVSCLATYILRLILTYWKGKLFKAMSCQEYWNGFHYCFSVKGLKGEKHISL